MSKVRFASPNEQRTISRESCGFYNALVIGGVYEFYGSGIDIRTKQFFYGAARNCVEKYPMLSVVVRDTDTDSSYFERVQAINLDEHISIVEDVHEKAQEHDQTNHEALHEKSDMPNCRPGNKREDKDAVVVSHQKHGKENYKDKSDDMKKVERLLPPILDRPWPAYPPPWRIVILPLSASDEKDQRTNRCFIGFSFSHALGDGISALAFHRTFHASIFDQTNEDCSKLVTITPVHDLPSPFDTPKSFPISWGYLMSPLIAVVLPKFIAALLGLRATTSAVDDGTWTGRKMFQDTKYARTCIRLIEIDEIDVENILQVARNNGARLTAVLHNSIVRALSRVVPKSQATNFVSGTAVNMRRAVGKSDDEMGLFVNAWYEYHKRDDNLESPWSEAAWSSVRALTKNLAECAVTLKDQPVGLLRYVPSIRKWTAGKIGQDRDDSYELSNLGRFEVASSRGQTDDNHVAITKMVFARPASAISSALTFSVVSVKASSMMITIGWQPGALGYHLGSDSEMTFINSLACSIEADLKNIR